MSDSEFPRLAVDNKTPFTTEGAPAASSIRTSPGMRPRCRHFNTVSDFQPRASAKALTVGQMSSAKTASMTQASDDVSGLSRTVFPVTAFHVVPSLGMSEKAYRIGLAERMRSARIARDVTQEQIGDWLGIGREAYRKHESRGSLPPYLFDAFAALTGLDVIYLLTGRKQSKRGPTPAAVTLKPKKRRA